MMSRLFASQLEGLQEHYASIVSVLSEIELHAITIAQSEDYEELPFQAFAINRVPKGPIIVGNDIFRMFKEVYGDYYQIADEHFASAPRSNHAETVNEIGEIARLFEDLIDLTIDCEIDVLLRLWFYTIWEDAAERNGACRMKDERKFYDTSIMTHLAYVVNHTLEKLKKYFGYLSQNLAKNAG